MIMLQQESVSVIRGRAVQLLNHAANMHAQRGSRLCEEITHMASLATGLLAYAAERELDETRPTAEELRNRLARHVDNQDAKFDPESTARRAARLDMIRNGGHPRRVDIFGMEVCECTGSQTAAPLVDGVCLRRWAAESLGIIGADEKTVEQILLAVFQQVEEQQQAKALSPALARAAGRVEPDRFLVVLNCGHWMQTRVPEPSGRVFACPFCEQPRSAAKLADDAHDSRAVLGSWEPYDAPIADGE